MIRRSDSRKADKGARPLCQGARLERLFRDEQGFTSTSMVLSLLITLALVFTSAQVYRINSASAETQNVADAAALAAESQVGEFMLVARFCDAVVLSLSLTGVAAFGLGIAALCTPPTATVSKGLIEAGEKVFQARNAFADRAKTVLSKLQKALPFFSAACAAGVAAANDEGSTGARYMGIALLVPGKGEPVEVDVDDGSDELADEVEENADDIREKAEEAEEAEKAANASKRRAFAHDCGNNPDYCMYERAAHLAGMTGSRNPLYSSVDTWSFSVALDRARRYYGDREANDVAENSSPAAQTRWRMRLAFYGYAADLLWREGYVHESEDSFDANFPSLPRNTAEMKQTSLYTDRAYPVSEEPSGEEGATMPVMHSYASCPGATGGITTYESVWYMDTANLPTCPECEFSPASLGKVAQASSSIDNGFEYHYLIVAREAEKYEEERRKADEKKEKVKESAGSLFDRLREVLKEAADKRIKVSPPGSQGAVAIVVNRGSMPADAGFPNGFVTPTRSLGPRVAISASTLIDEGSEEGRTILNSLLDGLRQDGGVAVGAFGIVLDVWSHALSAYSNGFGALTEGVESGLNQLPLVGESGLGTWAADALRSALESVGLQPAKLEALKPVLVNSAHVAGKDDGTFGRGLVSIKERIIAHPLYSTDLFSALLTDVERQAIAQVEGLGDSIEIASIELLGEGGPSLPIVIPLPEKLRQYGVGTIRGFFDRIRSLYVEVTGVRIWE